MSKYARAIDTCSNNGYDYADLFTADGYFAPDSERQGRQQDAGTRAAGRGIRRRLARLQERRLDPAGREALYVNHIITPTAEGATGTVDMLMIGLGGDPNKIRHEGYYEDTYVQDAAGLALQVAHSSRAGSGTTGREAAEVSRDKRHRLHRPQNVDLEPRSPIPGGHQSSVSGTLRP